MRKRTRDGERMTLMLGRQQWLRWPASVCGVGEHSGAGGDGRRRGHDGDEKQ